MMKRLVLLMVVFLIAVGSALFSTRLLAQPTAGGILGQPTGTATLAPPSATLTPPKPTATVALDSSSSCSDGLLDIAITMPITSTHQYGLATTSTGTVLEEFLLTTGLGTSYTGTYGFPFTSSAPSGTIVNLYGYVGPTSPSAANTAEFSLAYRCDTLEVFQECAGPYGICIKDPLFPALNGVWFKLNAVVTGNYVAIGNGAITPHNFSIPLYMGFVWNTTTNLYDVSVFTETAPGVWTNTYNTTRIPLIDTQNFFQDFLLTVYVNNTTDFFQTYHTTYISYVVNNTRLVKGATYSGSGEVFNGSFNAGASEYYGSVKISGSMVSVSHLPFTP